MSMKKRFVCGLMAAMLLLTTACGGSKETSEPAPAEPQDTPQAEGTEAGADGMGKVLGHL